MSNKDEAAQAAAAAHLALLEQLDIHSVHKTFRSTGWRPNQRRNKNIKTILGDASRREASLAATPADASGGASPGGGGGGGGGGGALSTSGTSTPAGAADGQPPNLAQASRSLSKLVLEKTLRAGGGAAGGSAGGGGGAGAPTVTYTNIESAPSMAHTRRYCDLTGLPAPYNDPKTRLRYHNKEVFGMIRSLPQGVAEQYLEARGAHTVLK